MLVCQILRKSVANLKQKKIIKNVFEYSSKRKQHVILSKSFRDGLLASVVAFTLNFTI